MSCKQWMFSCIIFFSVATLTHLNASPSDLSHHIRLIYAHGTDDISNNQLSGLANLATLLQQQRKIDGPVFFIYGGSFAPSTLSFYDQGAHIVDLLNTLSPDAMVLSKRNFIISREQLAKRSNQAMFPLVASNIQDSHSKKPFDGLVKTALVTQQGISLGIISLLDARVLVQNPLDQSEVLKQSVVKSLAKSLRQQGADLIVLHYAGYSKALAGYLNKGIVDLLIGGMDGDKRRPPNTMSNPRSANMVIGKHDVAIMNMSWSTADNNKLTVNTNQFSYKEYQGSVAINSEIADYRDFLEQFLVQSIGQTKVPLLSDFQNFRVEESAIGNFVADTVRDSLAADIAIINSGMLKQTLHLTVNQSITRHDIIRLIPYRTKTVLLEITGVKLLELLEHGVSAIDFASGRFPQVSGIQFSYDSNQVIGSRIAWVKINGRPLEFLTRYTLATSTYLARGGDGYQMLKSLPIINQSSSVISDLIVDKINQLKQISSSKQMRIRNISL